jgi:glycine betaine/proline transport system substrate-binding protein
MPEVYQLLDNFHWTPDQMQTVMAWNQQDNTDPYEMGKKWVKENPDVVAKWLPEGSGKSSSEQASQ